MTNNRESVEFSEEMTRLKANLESAEQYRLEGGKFFSLDDSWRRVYQRLLARLPKK